MSESKVRSRRYHVSVITERCKGCGYCIEFCPRHLLSKSDEINSRGYHLVSMDDENKCNGCNICGMVCPDFAISVASGEKEPEKEGE